MRNYRAAAGLLAAILLVACGAQPAKLPTVTPYTGTPTSSVITQAATATSVPVATPVSATTPVSQVTGGGRPFANLPPDQRSKIGTAPPPLTIDVTKQYVAVIQTSKGDITVQLDPSAAPQTVNNFVYLSQNGFYDGLTFHRVVTDFVIQGGDPLGNGGGGPGYTLPPEIKLLHVDGAIAMARTAGPPESTPNSGSQFYITIGAQPGLDNQYTVFGKTTAGLDVVRKIAMGDVIKRIDITVSDGSAVAVAPVATAVPVPASCSIFTLNVLPDDHIKGKAGALATLVEYADYQCPACGEMEPALETVFAQISDTVQVVFRHFPLVSLHDKAQITAQASEAAALQNKFWEMHDLLFQKQAEWSAIAATAITTTLDTYAKSLGLDVAKFDQDLQSAAVIARVDRDSKTAEALNLNGTPSVFLNGRSVDYNALMASDAATQLRDFANQRQVEVAGLTGKPLNVDKPDQVVETGAKYTATLKTSKGDITISIDPKLAPVNANSIIYLIQKGYLDNSPIVLNDNQLGAILFGSPNAQDNPGYDCSTELPAVGSFNKPGVVALYGDGQHTNSQIIITYSTTQQFESHFSVIGQVTSGLDIARTMQPSTGGQPGDKILTVTVTKQ